MERLGSAVRDVVERHDVLRTVFRASSGIRVPLQVILESSRPDWRHLDVSPLGRRAREAAVEEILTEDARRGFDLEKGPLLRASVVTLGDDESLLALTLPALCADGRSMSNLAAEVASLYAVRAGGHGPGELLDGAEALQYLQFSEWQNDILERDSEEGRAFWSKVTTEKRPDGVELPFEAAGAENRPFAPEHVPLEIDGLTAAGVEALARNSGSSSTAVWLAAWMVLLWRVSGQSRIAVAAMLENRDHEDLANVMGLLARSVPVRCRLEPEASFEGLLKEIDEQIFEASDWQEYFVREDPGPAASPKEFPIGFTVREWTCDLSADGLSLALYAESVCLERFKLELSCLRTGDSYLARLRFDPQVYGEGVVELLARRLETLLGQAVRRPRDAIDRLEILGKAERRRLLEELNETAAPFPQDQSVHQLFARQVGRTPEGVALVFAHRHLSYEGLDRRAEALARYLGQLGVGPETRVALLLERSPELLVGILGTLKAGGAFVALDAAQPLRRSLLMLADAQPRVLLTQARLAPEKPPASVEQVCLDTEWPRVARHRGGSPVAGLTPACLAYVLYTSGSTGRPKGVMVSHRALVNYLWWCLGAYAVADGNGSPVHSSPSFDLTVTSLFSPLLCGRRVVLVPEARGIEALDELLRSESEFSLLKLTPAHLRMLSYSFPAELLAGRTRVLVLGGEALHGESLATWRAQAPETRLINEYGPTETVVGCCAYEVPGPGVPGGAVAVGRPIANVRIYVSDSHLEPVPLGAAGEICVAGASLARGYLDRAAATCERFVPDPFSTSAGARLYKTGDLARYLPGGDLAFLGRTNGQVKIRGVRIEPGEVEAVLREHPAVREVVVLAREDVPGPQGDSFAGGRRLVAYLVSERPRWNEEELESFLRTRLPDPMVPDSFVGLEALPLLPNGKVDRAALPVPAPRAVEDPGAGARNAVETSLVEIWKSVLGLEAVGIHQNFFRLGGDSISSIQVVARAREAGLGLRPNDVFRYPTVAELAEVAELAPERPAEAGLVTGPVPLTPIQRWFFDQDLPRPEHFNLAVMLEAEQRLAASLVERALAHLMAHHDALRMRFTPPAGTSGWSQVNEGISAAVPMTQADLSALPGAAKARALEALARRLQASLDLTAGPLLRMVLATFGPADPDRLLWIIHHLVVDVVSWRILVEDLNTSYRQLARSETVVLPAKTASFKTWAESLAGTECPDALGAERRQDSSSAVPVDLETGVNSIASARQVAVALDAEETEALLRRVPRAYGTEINDVLLTAVVEAFRRWRGESRLVLDLEGHGRGMADLDVSRTVGWFTAISPVLLDVGAAGWAPEQALKSIKEQLRAEMGGGAIRPLPGAEVSFNYLGQFDQTVSGLGLFRLARESAGAQRDQRQPRAYLVEIGGGISGGRLRIAFTYSENRHRPATLETLARDFLEALRSLIAHCLSREARGYTSSDFPMAGLDQAALDVLAASRQEEIEDVYPTTALQRGMMFHSLQDPGSGVYVEHLSFGLPKGLDVPAFRGAWQRVVERHPILRTAFWGLEREVPLQVVYRETSLPWEEHDWRGISAAEQREKLSAYLSEDQQKGFDLSRPTQMRLELIRLSAESYWFLWSHHHAVLDGWSVGILLRELLAFYEAGGQGRKVRPGRALAYRNYVAWLESRDVGAMEAYWRRTLAGFGAPTPIGGDRGAGRRGAEGERPYGVCQKELSRPRTEALGELVRQGGLTLNTLFQGAWALLLGRYSAEEDVVFGVVHSGRSAPLAGIDEMVGLFINTLPARFRITPQAPLLPWLQELQARQAEALRYEHTPLDSVQAWSGAARGRPLFESILAFENYPVDRSARQAGGALGVEEVRFSERTNYPLNVAVTPGVRLRLKLVYDVGRFDASSMARLLGHLERMLDGMVSRSGGSLGSLLHLTRGETHQLLVEWNDTAKVCPQVPMVHELFAAHAGEQPAAPAFSDGRRWLSYGELEARANRLSHRLVSLGIGPEVLVAMCTGRTLERAVGILGVLKAGGAYVSLDPTYPKERLTFLLEDARAPVLLTEERYLDRLPDTEAAVICLDAGVRPDGSPALRPPVSGVARLNLAYVVYTSGSTGMPKGVEIPHAGLMNLVRWHQGRYEVRPSDRGTQVASPAFDASIWEFWPYLAGGASLHVPDEETRLSAPAMVRWWSREGITLAYLMTPLAEGVLGEPVPPRPAHGVRALIIGGDRLHRRPDPASGFRLMNHYGPAEYTVTSTVTAVPPAGHGVPSIGRPIDNTRIYLLDPRLRPVPVETTGELFVGGVGLARGYLERPALTAAKFLPDPLAEEPGARMYRTGDLVRFLPEGDLDFLGRLDDQVKVRGLRIELGEIESVLRRHPAVSEAVVLVRELPQERERGEKRLAAYLVPAGEPPAGEAIRGYLRDILPASMVPSAFVVLSALPLTPNGKVDRRALPEPEWASENTYVPPETPAEELLSGIFAAVLGVERVGRNDDFFELGGHSLLATRLISQAREIFAVELPVRAIFEAPTVAELARRITAREEVDSGPPLVPVSRQGDLPLSFAQQRLWFLDQLVPDNPFYNVFNAFRLEGHLGLAALHGALSELTRRQEVLRTRFPSRSGRPVQVIDPAADVELPVIDLAGLGDGGGQRSELGRLIREEGRRPFKLAQGPLLRVALVRCAARDHTLFLNLHHIISDGWSINVLFHELTALYGAYSRGEPSPLPELPIQYADFAVWQRKWLAGEVFERQLAYWRGRLAGIPTVLDLPSDRPRPAVETFRGRRQSVVLNASLVADLRNLSRRSGATLFMASLASYAGLLHRYTAQKDILVGTGIANRNRQALENLIGFFVNVLVLRTEIGADATWREILAQVRREGLEAYEHQDLPFEMLVDELEPERHLSHHPIAQVMLAFQNFPHSTQSVQDLGISVPKPRAGDSGTSKFDLTLFLSEAGERIVGVMEYNSDLFDPTTIRRLLEHFVTFLESALARPDSPIGGLELLGDAQRHQLSLEWGGSRTPAPPGPCLPEIFAAQVARRPDAVALSCAGAWLTYERLDARSRGLAGRLTSMGLGPEQRAGLFLEPSADLLVALLAIWKAAAVYVPLDPSHPAKRLADTVSGARLSVVVTRSDLALRLPDSCGARLLLDRDPGTIPGASGGRPRPSDPRSLAYVIYTSGSTGRPKGVGLTHRGLSNLMTAQSRAFRVRPESRVLQFASLTFDASVSEIAMTLAAGGCLHLAPRRSLLPGPELTGLLREQRISHLTVSPSALAAMESAALPEPVTLVVAGEACPQELVDRWAPGHRFFNAYGPTEATVCSTIARCRPGAGKPSIGRPMANTRAYLLGRGGRPVPAGVPAELHAAGPGLARGYLELPGRTAQSFVPDPFAAEPGERLYRTGDLARHLADGSMDFLGRIDHQVKIRGFRVEPGEVEGVLGAHPAVRRAVAVPRDDGPGGVSLAAYVVLDPEAEEARPGDGEQEWATRIGEWRSVFDKTYRPRLDDRDPTFNIAGWTSAYDGQAISAEEMREWVDATVTRILERRPARVLELGCGTGLLLFRIAPRCLRYVASDFSAAALGFVERHLGALGEAAASVELREREAHDFEGIEPRSFDAVVLNSVVQYFPSVEYLARVLERALEALAPGGFVFVGDVRSLPLLRVLAAAVESRRPAASPAPAQLLRRIDQRAADEPELVLDPKLFAALRHRLSGIDRVEIRLKRARRHNELNRYRFDVFLHVRSAEEPPAPDPELRMTPWRELTAAGAGRPLDALGRLLREARPEHLIVTGIPNARVAPDAGLLEQIERHAGEGDGREEPGATSVPAADPEDLWALAGDVPYEVEVAPSDDGSGRCFDARLRSLSVPPERRSPPFAIERPAPPEPWSAYGTRPGAASARRRWMAQLRRYLAETLPDYVVPSSLVVLDEIPLTASGKVDREALPAPHRLAGVPRGIPRNPVEEVLVGIWREVLNLDEAGTEDNFFDLGGHSLLATQLIARIGEACGVDLPLRSVFEAPTPASLAERVIEAKRAHVVRRPPAIRPVPRQGLPPLSFAQQRLWFLDQMAPGNTVYNVPVTLHVGGRLDASALGASLREIVLRHEVLRTTFHRVAGEPVQVIAPRESVGQVMSTIDMRALPAPRRLERTLDLARREARRPFHLARGPLLRMHLAILGDREHVAQLTMHHIVSDGWSMGVLVKEVGALYEAFSEGRPSPLADLEIQYADFAGWQRQWLCGEVLEAHLAYWKRQLADAPELELPADHLRPAVPTYRGAACRTRFSRELTANLRALGRGQQATVFMTLLAAFNVLLSRYSGQTDVVVGTPIAGRNPPQTEGLIGFFVNTLVLRTDLGDDPEFGRLLSRVREMTLSAYAHQDLPFDKLVEELQPQRRDQPTPLFRVMFALQNAPAEPLELPEVALRPLAAESEAAQFDLTVSLAEAGGALLGTWQLDLDLFDRATVQRMAVHFRHLLAAAARDPRTKLGSLPLLGPAEQVQVVGEWNDTAAGFPRSKCVHELFQEQVERSPESVAVVFGGLRTDGPQETAWTYRELDARAEGLARRLRCLGVGPEVAVSLFLERSPELVAACVATLKAGGFYVPLDPDYPEERLAFMLRDVGARVVLTAGALSERLPKLTGAREVRLDAVDTDGAAASESPAGPSAWAQSPAYVIYTSGTTGRPKGVTVPHRAVVRLVTGTEYVDLRACDRIAQAASPSFDAATFEIWGALLSGARLVILPRELALDMDEFAAAIRRQRISVLFLTTALFNQLSRERAPAFATLDTLLFGGEAVDAESVRRVLASGPPARLLHVYGPTESTTFTSSFRVTRSAETARTVAIGRPIANTSVLLLDRGLRPVPIGVAGEVMIAGDGLARGYFGRPALSAEKLVPNSLAGAPGGRMYRSGDLARFGPSGAIEFVGRTDFQVKIRGFRIELREIEVILASYHSVESAVAVARRDVPGHHRVLAYVVPKAGLEVGGLGPRLRRFLERKLPAYMVPDQFVVLESLPLDAHGKVERSALPEPSPERSDELEPYVAPRTRTELALVQIYEKLLETRPIGIRDDFFDLGGHSLLAVRLMAQVGERFGRSLPVAELFRNGTIEDLAALLQSESPSRPPSPLVAFRTRGESPPLFFVHPGVGEALCFYELSKLLGDAQPFYGLQARGVEPDQAPHTRIEDMASYYLEAIREVQREGPYRLGGWSFGGLVAFEIARQLSRARQTCSLLALVNATPPATRSEEWSESLLDDASILTLFGREVGLLLAESDLRGLDTDGQLRYVAELARKSRILPKGVGESYLRRLLGVFKANVRAAQQYTGGPYPGPLTLLEAGAPPDDAPEGPPERRPAARWARFAEGPVTICPLPGNHKTIMGPPHVQELARSLRELLEPGPASLPAVSDEIVSAHESLAPAFGRFLSYVCDQPAAAERLVYESRAQELPEWARSFPYTIQTWPALVGGDKLEEIRRATEGVTRLIRGIPERVLGNDPMRLAEEYGLDNEFIASFLLDPPNGLEGGLARCDFVDTASGLRCVEVNQGAVLGGWQMRFWQEMCRSHPPLARFFDQEDLDPFYRDPIRDFFVHVVRDVLGRGAESPPDIAVTYNPNEMPLTHLALDHVNALYSAVLEEMDLSPAGRIVICPHSELVEGPESWLGHGRFQAVVNCAETIPQEIFRRFKEGALVLYNTPLVRLLGHKRSLSLLSELQGSDLFDTEENEIIRRHLVWSRRVDSREITYEGETAYLPELLKRHRGEWVLKPESGIQGRDVHVGRYTSAGEWEGLVDTAVREGGWQAQAYVESRPYLFQYGSRGACAHDVVWGTFCFGGAYGGGFLRMTPKGGLRGVVNAARGASEGFFFEI